MWHRGELGPLAGLLFRLHPDRIQTAMRDTVLYEMRVEILHHHTMALVVLLLFVCNLYYISY